MAAGRSVAIFRTVCGDAVRAMNAGDSHGLLIIKNSFQVSYQETYLPVIARMADVKGASGLPVEEGRIRDAVAKQIQQFGVSL